MADNFDDGFDSGDSLADIASQAAGRTAHVILAKAEYTIWKAIKPYVLFFLAVLAIFIVVFFLLFGAANYISEAVDSFYKDVWLNLGVREDDYQTSYYEQAKNILARIRRGEIEIGNDMFMLSNEDLCMILEYVIQYNEDTTYETYPERIRFSYQEENYITETIVETGETVGNWVLTWENSYQTVSYQTLGKDMTGITMDNDFAVPWQTIVVLCEMMSENSYLNFGSDEDGWYSDNYEDFYWNNDNYEVSMNGYYVTDSQVQSICDMVSYTYDCYNTYYADYYRECDYDYIENTRWLVENGYAHLTGDPDTSWGMDLGRSVADASFRYKGDSTVSEVTKIKDLRVPELAPRSISNYFTKVNYTYTADPSQNNAYKCTSMTVTIDSMRFMNMVKTYIPNFTFDHFLELLEMLPGSEKEVEKYEELKDLYEQGMKAKEKYEDETASGLTPTQTIQEVNAMFTKTATYTDFPSAGVYIGLRSMANNSSDPGTDYEGADSIWIGTHKYLEGNVVMSTKEYNDYYRISDGAYLSLNSKDGLSKEELEKICDYIATPQGSYYSWASAFLSRQEYKDAIYQWSDSNNASVTAMLAMCIEGNGFNSVYNVDVAADWNLFGTEWYDGCGYSGRARNTDGKIVIDYKAVYCPIELINSNDKDAVAPYFLNALTGQFNKQKAKYFSNGHNQKCFFTMMFGSSYDLRVPDQDRYQAEEAEMTNVSIYWWDDATFPANKNDTTKVGWCNNCAAVRSDLMAAAGRTLDKPLIWPLESYIAVTSEFGKRTHPVTGEVESDHSGTDIAAREGTPIYAVGNGTVVSNGFTNIMGNYIKISIDGGIYQVVCMHMRDPGLQEVGTKVTCGETIGFVGHTGRTTRNIEQGGTKTGDHLHISVYKNGTLIDPRTVIRFPDRE